MATHIPEEVSKAKRSLVGYKSALMNKLNKLIKVSDQLSSSPSPALKELVEQSHAVLQKQLDNTESFCYSYLGLAADHGVDTTEVEDYLTEINDKVTEAQIQATTAIKTANDALAPSVQPLINPIQNVMPSSSQADERLCPRALTYDMDPIQFRQWKDDLRKYFGTSGIEFKPVSLQQGHLMAILSQDVRTCLEDDILPETAIYSDDPDEHTCFKVLDSLWFVRYPLHKRRVDYMGYTQPEGMDCEVYFHRMQKLAREAQLDKLTLEGAIVSGFTNGVLSKKLRSMLLSLVNKEKPEEQR